MMLTDFLVDFFFAIRHIWDVLETHNTREKGRRFCSTMRGENMGVKFVRAKLCFSKNQKRNILVGTILFLVLSKYKSYFRNEANVQCVAESERERREREKLKFLTEQSRFCFFSAQIDAILTRLQRSALFTRF